MSGAPTRVALVAPRFPPDVGGLETYVGWVARTLRDAPGFEVEVLTSTPGRRGRREVVDGVPVTRLAAPLLLSNSPLGPAWPVTVRRALRRMRPDVVNVHAPVPGLPDLAVLTAGGVPTVFTYHSGSLVKGGSPVDPLLRTYERHVLPRLFARCTELVAVSPVASTFATGRAELIPPGVDTRALVPPAGHPSRGPRLLFAGRLERSSRWKGVRVLLEALTELPAPTHLDVAGGGDDLLPLQAEAARLGLSDRVTWHGPLDRPALTRLYQEARATVLPSLTESESFGMTLVEAMACGSAVVGSRVGGIPYVVDEGVTGLLVPPGDAPALAATLRRLLDDAELAARLGAAGREQAVARFDWEHQRELTLEVLSRASQSGRSPAVRHRRAVPS